MVAAAEALKDSGIDFSKVNRERMGVSLANAICGTKYMEEEFALVTDSGKNPIDPTIVRPDLYDASMFNTPPVFPIYMFGKVLKWMKKEGGLAQMEANAAEKSGLLYDMIDNSGGYYNCPVEVASRSHMNVVFRLPSEELEAKFLAEAGAADLMNLKGHRSVGGCRASIYNAMPRHSVEALVSFMTRFQADNG